MESEDETSIPQETPPDTDSVIAPAPEVQPVNRKRTERKFPSLTLQDALALAHAIQQFAAGQKVRRLALFESWINLQIARPRVN